MSLLDRQKYVLLEQRDLPREERIVWTYRVPTFGTDLVARRHARAADKDSRDEEFVLARLAGALESSCGMVRDGMADDFPAQADLDARLAWVLRLPPSWVRELAGQVAEESDLDPEAE